MTQVDEILPLNRQAPVGPVVDTMAADVLVMQGAGSSAAMILISSQIFWFQYLKD